MRPGWAEPDLAGLGRPELGGAGFGGPFFGFFSRYFFFETFILFFVFGTCFPEHLEKKTENLEPVKHFLLWLSAVKFGINLSRIELSIRVGKSVDPVLHHYFQTQIITRVNEYFHQNFINSHSTSKIVAE